MTIINDQIQFDAIDFDRLSDFAKKALLSLDPDFMSALAERLNGDIRHAKSQIFSRTPDPVAADLALAVLQADPAKFDDIRACIDKPVQVQAEKL